MLNPNSTIEDLQLWVQEQSYLSEKTHSVSSAQHNGVIVDEILSKNEEQELLAATDEPPFGSVVFKFGHRSFVSACPIGDQKLAFKYYHRLSLRRQLGYTLWGSRCMRAWIAARAFQAIGIPTPQPIAVLEKNRWGILRDTSILVTHVSQGIPLPQFLAKWADDSEKMHTLAAHCLEIFGIMAKFRVIHRDTAPKNFIVAPDASVHIIDLDAVELAMPEAKWQAKRKKDIQRFSVICSQYPQIAPLFKDLS